MEEGAGNQSENVRVEGSGSSVEHLLSKFKALSSNFFKKHSQNWGENFFPADSPPPPNTHTLQAWHTPYKSNGSKGK
jgi:hypothetical protein